MSLINPTMFYDSKKKLPRKEVLWHMRVNVVLRPGTGTIDLSCVGQAGPALWTLRTQQRRPSSSLLAYVNYKARTAARGCHATDAQIRGRRFIWHRKQISADEKAFTFIQKCYTANVEFVVLVHNYLRWLALTWKKLILKHSSSFSFITDFNISFRLYRYIANHGFCMIFVWD